MFFDESKIKLEIESARADCLAWARGHPGRPHLIKDLLEEVTTPGEALEGKGREGAIRKEVWPVGGGSRGQG